MGLLLEESWSPGARPLRDGADRLGRGRRGRTRAHPHRYRWLRFAVVRGVPHEEFQATLTNAEFREMFEAVSTLDRWGRGATRAGLHPDTAPFLKERGRA